MRKTLVKIYFAFIRPVLEYSDVVRDNCSEKDSKLLNIVKLKQLDNDVIPLEQNCMMN